VASSCHWRSASLYQDRRHIHGYKIPANSIVLGNNHFAIGRDESVFGENPDAFIPERWIDEKGQLKELPLIGFGFGRRIYTGRHIARNGLYIHVVRLMWEFDITAGNQQAPIDDMDATEGFASRPKPFQAVFRPRGDWVRHQIMKAKTMHDFDHSQILDQIKADRLIGVKKG
jgi:cytochrome P450